MVLTDLDKRLRTGGLDRRELLRLISRGAAGAYLSSLLPAIAAGEEFSALGAAPLESLLRRGADFRLGEAAMEAAASQAAQPASRIRRHLRGGEREEQGIWPYPLADEGQRLYDLEADDNPTQYTLSASMGGQVSYERPGNWLALLPETRKGLRLRRHGRDEAQALADDVKWTSRLGADGEPTYYPYARWPESIERFYEDREGMCEERNYILAALLRRSLYPARKVITWNQAHTFVQTRLEGKWFGQDATPHAQNGNRDPADLYAPDDPSVLAAFQVRPLSIFHDVPLPSPDTRTIDTVILLQDQFIHEREKWRALGLERGAVAFPVTNDLLYFDSGSGAFIEHGAPGQRVAIMHHIDAEDDLLLNNRNSWYAAPLSFLSPSTYALLVSDDPSLSGWNLVWARGQNVVRLPTCTRWKVVYDWTNLNMNTNSTGDMQSLAYQWVSPAPGRVEQVRPEKLEMMPGADPYFFRKLQERLGSIKSYEELGGR